MINVGDKEDPKTNLENKLAGVNGILLFSVKRRRNLAHMGAVYVTALQGLPLAGWTSNQDGARGDWSSLTVLSTVEVATCGTHRVSVQGWHCVRKCVDCLVCHAGSTQIRMPTIIQVCLVNRARWFN